MKLILDVILSDVYGLFLSALDHIARHVLYFVISFGDASRAAVFSQMIVGHSSIRFVVLLFQVFLYDWIVGVCFDRAQTIPQLLE